MNRRYWILTGTALLLLILYGLFDPERHRFPRCPFMSLTGWKCPGCGSQRAMHQVLHGHPDIAFMHNPLFLPAILYALVAVLLQVAYPTRWPAIRKTWYGLYAARVWLFIILVFWVGRNVI